MIQRRKEGEHPSFLLENQRLITEEKIQSLVDECISSEQFIVVLQVNTGNRIYIELDNMDKPTSISDCIALSRHVEHSLDREAEDFSLEVASPGLEKPFRVFKQYVKNIGRPVKVKFNDGGTIEGELVSAEGERITLKTREKKRIEGRKAKEWVEELMEIPTETIKETLIKIVF